MGFAGAMPAVDWWISFRSNHLVRTVRSPAAPGDPLCDRCIVSYRPDLALAYAPASARTTHHSPTAAPTTPTPIASWRPRSIDRLVAPRIAVAATIA